MKRTSLSSSLGKRVRISKDVERYVEEFINRLYNAPTHEQRLFISDYIHKSKKQTPSLNDTKFAELMSSRLGEEISRKVIRRIVGQICEKQKALAKLKAAHQMEKTSKARERLLQNAARLGHYSEMLSTLETLTDTERLHAAAGILNSVRLAASDLLPADYAEGVQEFSLRSKDELISLGVALGEGHVEEIRQDLSAFILTLTDCADDSEEIDVEILLRLVMLGSDLAIVLAGHRSNRIAFLAELNKYTVGKHSIPYLEFYAETVSMAKAAINREYDENGIEVILECLAQAPSDEQIPTLKRIAAMALNNGITLVQAECLRHNSPGSLELILPGIELVKEMTSGLQPDDGLVYFQREIELFQMLVESELGCSEKSDLRFRYEQKEISDLLAFSRKYEDDRGLRELLEQEAFRAYPELQYTVPVLPDLLW